MGERDGAEAAHADFAEAAPGFKSADGFAAHIDQAFAVLAFRNRNAQRVGIRDDRIDKFGGASGNARLYCALHRMGAPVESGFRVFVYQVFEFRQAHCGETLRLISRRRIGEGGGKRGTARNERAWRAAVGAPVGPRYVSQS